MAPARARTIPAPSHARSPGPAGGAAALPAPVSGGESTLSFGAAVTPAVPAGSVSGASQPPAPPEPHSAPEDEVLPPGTLLCEGRYRIADVLGRGASGVTYRCVPAAAVPSPREPRASPTSPEGGAVACKVVRVRGMRSWKKLDLFEREARTLRGLRHPGIPRYRGFWRESEADGGPRFVLAQDLAPGASLAELVAAGARPGEREVARIAVDALRVLSYLASRRPPVVHRDISPANLVIRPIREGDDEGDGVDDSDVERDAGGVGENPDRGFCVSLVDFGAVQAAGIMRLGGGARAFDDEEDDEDDASLEGAQLPPGWPVAAQLGRRGPPPPPPAAPAPQRLRSTVVGTVGFVAPEQLTGDATPASDLYGLGASLLWVLTGKRPSAFIKGRMRVDLSHASIGPVFRELLEGLLEPMAEDRLDADEALEILSEIDRPRSSAGEHRHGEGGHGDPHDERDGPPPEGARDERDGPPWREASGDPGWEGYGAERETAARERARRAAEDDDGRALGAGWDGSWPPRLGSERGEPWDPSEAVGFAAGALLPAPGRASGPARRPAREGARAPARSPPGSREPLPPPLGSNISVWRRGRMLEITIPPNRAVPLPDLAFSLAWNGFVAFWTASAVQAGQPLLALFSAPFWLAGVSMLRGSFGRARLWERVRLGPRRWRVDSAARAPWTREPPVWDDDATVDALEEAVPLAGAAVALSTYPGASTVLAQGSTSDLAFVQEEGEGSHDGRVVLVGSAGRVPLGAGLDDAERAWLADCVDGHLRRLRARAGASARRPPRP